MLGSIDHAIVALYLVLTFAIGFWSRKGGASARGFFVAEKSLPFWVVGLTMVAASISAEQMLGEVGYGFDAGLVVSNWDLGIFPAVALMVLVFLPLYLRSGITTIPEYLERRYGRSTRLLFAVYTVLNNACITLVMVLALGALALKQFLGLDPVWGAGLLALFTGVYTVYGGMSSVAWTDTFQCVLLLAGGLTVFGVSLGQVDGGWQGLFSRMGDPHLIRGLSDPYVPWPGLLLLMLSTNVWYCCTNQFYVQSCLGAKDEWHGRMGVLLTAFLGPVLTLCFAFPGYIASDLIRTGRLPPLPVGEGGPDVNAVYPHLIASLLGPGLRGFLVAAVLGAIMSTVSSVVNATASVYTMDIFERWIRPGSSDRRLLRQGRLAGAATLALAWPLSVLVMDYRYVFTYSQNAWCILAIPIMLVFTLGALWSRPSERAAKAVLLLDLPFVAVPVLLGNRDDSWISFGALGRMHFFNFAAILWVASAAFFVGASFIFRPPDREKVAPYVWRPRSSTVSSPERPLFLRVGFWCLLAGALYLIIYIRFW
jgi:solute:Na+ symporter, SSS family